MPYLTKKSIVNPESLPCEHYRHLHKEFKEQSFWKIDSLFLFTYKMYKIIDVLIQDCGGIGGGFLQGKANGNQS